MITTHSRRIIHDSWLIILILVFMLVKNAINSILKQGNKCLLKCCSNSNNHGWTETGQPRGRLFPQQGRTKNCWIKIDYRSVFECWYAIKLPFVCKSHDISDSTDSVFSLPHCHTVTPTYLFLVYLLPQPVEAITVMVGEWWVFHHGPFYNS